MGLIGPLKSTKQLLIFFVLFDFFTSLSRILANVFNLNSSLDLYDSVFVVPKMFCFSKVEDEDLLKCNEFEDVAGKWFMDPSMDKTIIAKKVNEDEKPK